MTAETDLLPLPEEECMGGNDVYGVEYPLYTSDHMQSYARANVAELQREVEGLRALLVPGLRVYEGDHVVQVAVGPRLFTSRYIDAADKPRALRHAIATARAALDQETTNG